MAFCKNCGEELNENQAVCLKCGVAVSKPKLSTQPIDSGGIGWGILGFCFPIIGLILYLVWKNDRPLSAKDAGTGALIGFVLGIIAGVVAAGLGV